MICKTLDDTPITLINHLKWIRNQKVMRLESRSGQNEEIKKKKNFLQLEKPYSFYCAFLAGPLALHFQDDL